MYSATRWTVLAECLIAACGCGLQPSAERETPPPPYARLVFEIVSSEEDHVAEEQQGQLIQAVTRRVNPQDNNSTVVRPLGEHRIEVIVPASEEAELERLAAKITSPGLLEFRILANRRDHADILESARTLSPDENLLVGDEGPIAEWVPVHTGREDQFPEDSDTLRRETSATRPLPEDSAPETPQLQVLVIRDDWNINGSYLEEAIPRPEIHRAERWSIVFTLSKEGGILFGRLTGEYRPDDDGFCRRLGVILDGKLYSAPTLRGPIFRYGQITGDFTEQEAKDIADVLNAGSLPARIRLVQKEIVQNEPDDEEHQ